MPASVGFPAERYANAYALFNEPLQAQRKQRNKRAMPSLRDATRMAGFPAERYANAYALWRFFRRSLIIISLALVI
ncbi:hypothetical protein [Nostoc sp.]|uniref:hypothetical protein n=1 Tax=Nostoc sp. TaxID=1180 RepID=UPI002FF7B992